MKKIAVVALAIVAMVGCEKESDFAGDNSAEVKFLSSNITRVSDDGGMWGAAESVGISMYNVPDAGGEVLDGTGNVKYVSGNSSEAATVDFTVAAGIDPLLYPNVGNVKFYAYYPYGTLTDGCNLSIDTSTQNGTQNGIVDFMVASTEEAVNKSTGNVSLLFTHKMAKLIFEITGNDNVSSVAGVTAKIETMNTVGKYNICTGALATGEQLSVPGDINCKMDSNSGSTTTVYATAIVHPQTLTSDINVIFTLPVAGSTDRTFKVTIAKGAVLYPSKSHKYEVALGNDKPTFVGSTITEWGEPLDQGSLYTTED